jgi:hypothetical protein
LVGSSHRIWNSLLYWSEDPWYQFWGKNAVVLKW